MFRLDLGHVLLPLAMPLLVSWVNEAGGLKRSPRVIPPQHLRFLFLFFFNQYDRPTY